ncbi:MAG: hypothetical protein ABFE13_01480 [Phycisphaerales bacterium]
MGRRQERICSNKVRRIRDLLAKGVDLAAFLAEDTSELLLKGSTPRATKLQRMLDECPEGRGAKYEEATLATLKVCLAGIVDTVRARQHVPIKSGFCDIELPFRQERLCIHPYWSPWHSKYDIRSILTEVKNERKPVGPYAIRQIRMYLEDANRGRFGMIISRNGFTKNAMVAACDCATSRRDGDILILPLCHDDLKELVRRSDQGLCSVTDFLCEKERDLLQIA